jgi:photosystem II stability/assembly factor-like uncharacterized protein
MYTPRLLVGAIAATALLTAPAHASVQVSQSGWQWGNPTPQGNTIRAIDFVQGRGYAIGDDGTALRTDDGGATWTGLATGTSQDLTRVQAVTPDVVVVLGGGGCVVRRSDDGGKTFHKMFVLAETNCPDKVAASYFVTPQVGYLLLQDGNVLRTTDGGQTFGRGTAIPGTPASAGGGRGVPADAIFTSPDAGIVFIAGTNIAYRSTDDGASWTPEPDVAAGNVQRVKATDGTTFYAFGPNTLLQSTDAGQTWGALGGAAGNAITGISCTLLTCLMTTDKGDKLLRSEDGGKTVAAITASTAPLFAAGFATASRAVAAGSGGATAVSDDAGKNYTPVGGDIAGSFQFGLRLGPANNIALALGAKGQLARSTDGGVTWKAINVATSADMRDTSFSTQDDGYALDQRGGLFRTTNGGASWQPIDPGTTSPPRAVITSGSVVLLAGPKGVRKAMAASSAWPAARRAPSRSTSSTAPARRSSPTARPRSSRPPTRARPGPSSPVRRASRAGSPSRSSSQTSTWSPPRPATRSTPLAVSGTRPTASPGPSSRAWAPTAVSRSPSARRRPASSRSTTIRLTRTSPTSCARATAASTGVRSGSPAGAFPAARG